MANSVWTIGLFGASFGLRSTASTVPIRLLDRGSVRVSSWREQAPS